MAQPVLLLVAEYGRLLYRLPEDLPGRFHADYRIRRLTVYAIGFASWASPSSLICHWHRVPEPASTRCWVVSDPGPYPCGGAEDFAQPRQPLGRVRWRRYTSYFCCKNLAASSRLVEFDQDQTGFSRAQQDPDTCVGPTHIWPKGLRA